MTISILCFFQGVVCCHISVGFLLYYLFYWAMRRPQLVNNQRRSALFCYTLNPYWINQTILANNKQQY